jgi:uridine kinase
VARNILNGLPLESAVIVDHDSYYRDRSDLPVEERSRENYDHPNALENELLIAHIKELREGRAIRKPVYDFKAHTRLEESVLIRPAPIVIVEGILILVDPRLRELMDVRIFVDTAADIRVFRRIRRDIEERGRSFQSIREQYYDTVRPMHLAFVEPSKAWADVIIPEGGENKVAIDLVIGRLKPLVAEAWKDRDPG